MANSKRRSVSTTGKNLELNKRVSRKGANKIKTDNKGAANNIVISICLFTVLYSSSPTSEMVDRRGK